MVVSSVVSGSQPIGADVGGGDGRVQLDTLRGRVAHASQRLCFCKWSGGGDGEIRRTTSRLSQAHPGREQKMEQRVSESCSSVLLVAVAVGEGFRFSDDDRQIRQRSVGDGLARACLRAVRYVTRAGYYYPMILPCTRSERDRQAAGGGSAQASVCVLIF